MQKQSDLPPVECTSVSELCLYSLTYFTLPIHTSPMLWWRQGSNRVVLDQARICPLFDQRTTIVTSFVDPGSVNSFRFNSCLTYLQGARSNDTYYNYVSIKAKHRNLEIARFLKLATFFVCKVGKELTENDRGELAAMRKRKQEHCQSSADSLTHTLTQNT
ncbi:hypothetical protein ACTXT7_003216 [Hymenolepis weldensis]